MVRTVSARLAGFPTTDG